MPKLDTRPILAVMVVGAFLILVFVLVLYPPQISGDQATLMTTTVSGVGAAVMMILTFYFGSSRSSSDKDATLTQIATNQLPPPPTDSGSGGPQGTAAKPMVVDATVHDAKPAGT